MSVKKKPSNKKQKAKVKTKANHHDVKRKPRAQRLPGMEDAGIQELENLAEEMTDAIAEKKENMANEKNLNEQLVEAMKRHGKTVYSHRGIHINLKNTETAKVVIKEVDDTPADNEPAPAAKVNSESLAVDSEA